MYMLCQSPVICPYILPECIHSCTEIKKILNTGHLSNTYHRMNIHIYIWLSSDFKHVIYIFKTQLQIFFHCSIEPVNLKYQLSTNTIIYRPSIYIDLRT